jgi:hypothetical protein
MHNKEAVWPSFLRKYYVDDRLMWVNKWGI